jgi:hypothetical protein
MVERLPRPTTERRKEGRDAGDVMLQLFKGVSAITLKAMIASLG